MVQPADLSSRDHLDDAHEEVSQSCPDTAILLPRSLGIKSRNSLTANEHGVIGRDTTHAVQVGSPLENVLALYRTAGSLTESIDASLRSIGGEEAPGKINLAKLF